MEFYKLAPVKLTWFKLENWRLEYGICIFEKSFSKKLYPILFRIVIELELA